MNQRYEMYYNEYKNLKKDYRNLKDISLVIVENFFNNLGELDLENNKIIFNAYKAKKYKNSKLIFYNTVFHELEHYNAYKQCEFYECSFDRLLSIIEYISYFNENDMTIDKKGLFFNKVKCLKTINKKFPYIYFYDVSAKTLELDDTMFSNKLLIDNRGDINVFTNYGYPTSLSLINNETVETIFDRTDYIGVPLSIYRTRNNEQISNAKYLNIMEEVPDEVYGIRLITNRGMYNEVIDKECKTSTCNTKLVMDKEFSTYFDNITFTNGKYIFIKDTPTTIYNIEKYVSTTE